ncbi:hypothetical protein SAMD00019534_107180 [Acytostelium subglobosum LB1]|uniref:hypothetical protein n=1 Tax=Acytostelium subglobosum LB1 TaxID=1410327 RepID=UPI000644A985|nr:hypothetical protein SAMD00019534_107180 [Acytostelium subglobosum LB1]GAM27542.1 hypothetical protein SAMD00019534_107180 [Acytostelium subglobosum LB1]|eukprot:XP_012749607.1 hypothetical protein SAMD00019534_107180 [Acytostelium subglobosum LB1]
MSQSSSSENNNDNNDTHLSTILNVVENVRVQYLLVNVVVDHFKNLFAIKSSEQWIEFLRVLFSRSVVDQKERKELYDLLLYLPPAAIGDLNDRNKSRVLIDLIADVGEAVSRDRRSAQTMKTFIEEISSILVEYIQQRGNQSNTTSVMDQQRQTFLQQCQLLALLLQNLTKAHRSKVLLQNLILSRVLPLSSEHRPSLLDKLFTYPPTSTTSATTTTTTTTTTSTSSSTS